MEKRTRFEAAMDKRQSVEIAEKAGKVADSKEVRLALMERVHNGEITLAQAQSELTKIKRGAKAAGIEHACRVMIEHDNKETSDLISVELPCGTDLYSAETVARLIADRDSWESNCKYHMRLSQERDGMISELREQRPVAWMLTVGDYIITSHQTARPDDQDDWKPLYSQPATSQSTNRETLFDAHASQVDREIGE